MLDDILRHSKILIVDDELANVRLLQLILDREGYDHVSMTTDPREVLALFERDEPDLVLLDLHMPHLTGYEVMEALMAQLPAESYFPIVVLTADSTPAAKRRALTSGATDFVCKPFDNLEVVQRIKNVLQTRHLHRELREKNQTLEERVQERTVGMETAVAQLHTAQQQVVQQERLRALGEMAAGIAHDFNNLLSLILGYGEMLLREVNEQSRPAQYIRNIIGASQDGVEMVKRLAKFQRPPSETDLRQPIHLPDLVNEAIELTKPRWKGEALARNVNISIETEFNDASDIVGDPAEFRDLLINTIFNAVDAMPAGGTITFRTQKRAGSVSLEIADTGVGMSEETRERCLEPFYTTKGAHGSGLGLAMIYGITKRHNGTLDIQTKLGEGTTIQICLPNETKTGPVKKVVAEAAPSAPLRVLVVDDQPLLCEILVDYLHKDGHRTATANGGEEALQKFQAGIFDLVITDSAMPGMSGNELAVAIRKARDETMVILLTGFAESGVSSSKAPEIDAVVGKPVVLATLRQAIAQALADRPPAQSAADERPLATAGFLRTRPEGSLILQTIKDHLTGEKSAAYFTKRQTRS